MVSGFTSREHGNPPTTGVETPRSNYQVMGDGVLVDFVSAVEAVRCAVPLQEAMAEANHSRPETAADAAAAKKRRCYRGSAPFRLSRTAQTATLEPEFI